MGTTKDSFLRLAKSLSAYVGVPLQGNGKFARGAYYVVGRLLRLIVLSAIIYYESYSLFIDKS